MGTAMGAAATGVVRVAGAATATGAPGSVSMTGAVIVAGPGAATASTTGAARVVAPPTVVIAAGTDVTVGAAAAMEAIAGVTSAALGDMYIDCIVGIPPAV
mmetsp:Transcript_98375/g.173705  ORF Transcript_98375/g.173705 Transcript_98375/m.173705 type:complete len:101 (+) Transcript_98375:599-901(+)